MGFQDGVSLYAYVGNDPISLIDPLGLQARAPTPGRGTGWDPRRYPSYHWYQWMERGEAQGWRYAHCMASCESAKWSTSWASNLMGVANEARQTVNCLTSSVECHSAWAKQDFDDNRQGRACPANKSCEEQCKDLKGENKTRDQYGPFYGWGWK